MTGRCMGQRHTSTPRRQRRFLKRNEQRSHRPDHGEGRGGGGGKQPPHQKPATAKQNFFFPSLRCVGCLLAPPSQPPQSLPIPRSARENLWADRSRASCSCISAMHPRNLGARATHPLPPPQSGFGQHVSHSPIQAGPGFPRLVGLVASRFSLLRSACELSSPYGLGGAVCLFLVSAQQKHVRVCVPDEKKKKKKKETKRRKTASLADTPAVSSLPSPR